MNFTSSNIISAVVVVLAVIYIVLVLRKLSQGISFANALNPFSSAPVQDELTISLQPIIKEIETKEMANFIKHWSDKFEHNKLSVEDVELLNSRIEAGSKDQVNGILSLHPNGRTMYNVMNEELKLKAAALALSLKTETAAAV